MCQEDITPQLGHLVIREMDFVIDTASITESCDSDGEQHWDVFIGTIEQVTTEPFMGIEMPTRWAPNIRGEAVRVDAPPFSSIVGQTVLVPEAYDDETDEYGFSMYIFSHEEVFDSTIRVLERNGDSLRIEWRGKCNINFDEVYGEDVPFALLADFQIG